MKTIKEGFLRKNLGLGKEELIRRWLDKYCYINGKYTINGDMVDVDGTVEMIRYPETQLPDYIQFGYVADHFDCRWSKLTSLRGVPKKIGGIFLCRFCDNLKSLENGPEKVHESFLASDCKNLTSLKGTPEEIEQVFDCSGCSSLISLNGCPKKCAYFQCNNCGKQFTKDDVKKVCKVKKKIYV